MKFTRFDEIAHKPLQVYNRAVMFSNIYEDHGHSVARDYAEQFSPEDRLLIAQMIALVKNKGVKYVQKLVTDGVDFIDYPVSEVQHV